MPPCAVTRWFPALAVCSLLQAVCALSDNFEEVLHLRPLPKIIDSPDVHLARWEFTVRAPATEAFLSNQFDLFPSPIGKLLNARLAQCFHSLMVVSKHVEGAPRTSQIQFVLPQTLCHQTANPTRTKAKGICAHLRPPQLEAMSAEEKDGDSSVSPTDLMRDAIQKGREEIEKHGEVVRDAIQKGREKIEEHGEEVLQRAVDSIVESDASEQPLMGLFIPAPAYPKVAITRERPASCQRV
eukprot:s5952_g3.t1